MPEDLVTRLAEPAKPEADDRHPRAILRAMFGVWLLCAVGTVWILLSACAPKEEVGRGYGFDLKREFKRDRENCQRVIEQTTPYVDPKDGRAVATRSYRVEGEVQKCMLSRGWNDPRFDGWKAGRS